MSSYYMPCNYCGYVGEEGGGERDINGVSLGRYRLKGGKSWAGEDMSGSPLQASELATWCSRVVYTHDHLWSFVCMT